jgi:hypothetical protein
MARLSKHGRELLRVEKEKEITDPSENITWERTTRAYMSDGTVLAKHDVRFKPNSLYGGQTGEFYSWGWKIFGKIKADRTPEQAVANISEKMTADSKWKIVSGGTPPVILSTKRIMAAIESGENAGFCKACGAQAYNVEPDARNYTCESCGQPEVYGAEECLI